jgi:hypothetical protein
MNPPEKTFTVALYTTDPLESARPILCISGPAQQLEMSIKRKSLLDKFVRQLLGRD